VTADRFSFAGARASVRFLLADGGGPSAAADAIAMLDGALVERVPLAGAPGAIARCDGTPVIVLDLASADDDLAHSVILSVDAAAHTRALPLVVAMGVAQIDLVMSAITASGAQLLCDPTPTDWIAALAVAGAGGAAGVRDPGGEEDRLARMSAEVARVAELLARLASTETDDPSRAADRRQTFAPPPPAIDIAATTVRDVIRARRLRDRFLGEALFEDPAWDILLDLFAAHLERARVSVSSLCIAAAVPTTTALRWIGKMSDVGLLARVADPDDRRRAFIALSPDGLGAMRRYVAALAEAKLPLV
jgi:DNA-binding MarR family transcriptional regulator